MGSPYLRAKVSPPSFSKNLAADGLVPEVVDAARPYATELPDASQPELHGEVRVRPHARGELHAVAPHELPHPAVDQRGRRGRPRPVGAPEGLEVGEEVALPEGGWILAVVARRDAPGGLATGLDHRPREHEPLVPDLLDGVEERGVPPRAGVHVVVHVGDEVGGGERRRRVHREADPGVALAAGVVEPLGAHPVERAVGALVDVHDHLVRHRRVAPDRLHAQAQVGQVVPGGDHDREARAGRRAGRGAGLDPGSERLEGPVPTRHREPA